MVLAQQALVGLLTNRGRDDLVLEQGDADRAADRGRVDVRAVAVHDDLSVVLQDTHRLQLGVDGVFGPLDDDLGARVHQTGGDDVLHVAAGLGCLRNAHGRLLWSPWWGTGWKRGDVGFCLEADKPYSFISFEAIRTVKETSGSCQFASWSLRVERHGF